MKPISILEFPSNLGLKEPLPGQEPGVKRLPAWLRQHHFHNRIAPADIRTLPPPTYQAGADQEAAVLNAGAIVQYAREQARFMRGVLAAGKFPLVIGGDCSILLGSAVALKQIGNYALFYLDGHTDFMEPAMSQTGGAAGMVAALVAGLGPEKLTNILGQRPYFQAADVWCVGNREYDDAYENVIRHAPAHYVSLSSLRETGIAACINAFLEMVQIRKLDGFWLHIDVDVLDDAVMPAVDSRTPGGLTYAEFDLILRLLLASPKAAGLEITILDPDLDPTGQYTREFVRNFTHSFHKARECQP
jgi:arginase